jgi:aspartate kinase
MNVIHINSASIADAAGVNNVIKILESMNGRPMLLVTSAMGSTTHTLEAITEAYFAGKREDALNVFQTLFRWHLDQIHSLSGSNYDQAISHLDEFRTEVEWLLHDRPVRPFDYYYDQIVCAGVLMSSVILSTALKQAGIKVHWTDVRDVIRTDDQFKNALIDISFTQQQIDRLIRPALSSADILVTQGFIGSTDENESTTFGAEGLEKTAAILADCLNTTVSTL